MFTSIDFLRNILEYEEEEVSSLEISLLPNARPAAVVSALEAELGNQYIVKTRAIQNDFLYKVMRNERWVVYLILTFILIIAAFNMIGSISMLVIDKRKDIGTLRAMGATEAMIRNIFFFQGLLQTLLSIGTGFLLATLLCVLQIQFGLVTIPGSGSFVITAYPIVLQGLDYLYVGLTILVIGSIASWLPAHLASREVWLFREAE
jgi:lipoprotein-releasing system permease protein